MFKGHPIALVFAKAVLAGPSRLSDRDRISLAASHELAEMPIERGEGTLYAYQVCDAVEAKHFPVNGLYQNSQTLTHAVCAPLEHPLQKRTVVQWDTGAVLERGRRRE
jgi:hypothetical protein